MPVRRINYKIISIIICSGLVYTASATADNGQSIYNKACKMCHGSGMMKAPKTGDKSSWEPRIAKGMDTLYDHAINGFQDVGNMPARGGKKNLTDDEVKSAVDYMVEKSK